MQEFVGVDGEGGNVTDGYGFTTHMYTLLRAGEHYTTGPRWLDFLATLPRKKCYIAYMFDYDVTMMCRDATDDENLKLLVTGQPAYAGPYTLQYRPRKEFVIKGKGSYTVINDVFTFFQSSFVTAMERWEIGTPEELDMIRAGKDQRNEFGQLTDEELQYNELECRLLVRLMDKFRNACIAIGYIPARWQGPGQLAKAMLRKHHIPKTKDLPEPNLAGIWEAAQAAYYGGRFETSAVGPIKGPIEGWDINSAYPAAITNLPCLSHMDWTPSREIKPNGIYRITYTHPEGLTWHGLPHRRPDGSIHYPRKGGGWYWGVELLSAQRVGAKLSVRYGFEWTQRCEHRQFDFLHRLYSVRKAIGKTTAGIALKLAMNSVYGVLAQSIGTAPYANPIYAGLITALTRAKLLDAISISPSDVYMCATDGIYAREGLPLTASTELGGWDRTLYPDGMHIVMPGVYFAGDTTHRTRGVPERVVKKHRDRLENSYDRTPTSGITVPLRQFISLRAAMARNRLDLAGQWVDEDHLISYNWRTKRREHVTHTDDGDRTWPYEGDEAHESTPYSRIIGGDTLRGDGMLTIADAPDWADLLTEI